MGTLDPATHGFRRIVDPEFTAKAAEVVGLYMAPPDKAIVICVDRSLPSRRWSGRRATSSCPTGVRSAVTRICVLRLQGVNQAMKTTVHVAI